MKLAQSCPSYAIPMEREVPRVKVYVREEPGRRVIREGRTIQDRGPLDDVSKKTGGHFELPQRSYGGPHCDKK